MEKLITIMLVLFLGFVLTGCGQELAQTPASHEADGAEMTLESLASFVSQPRGEVKTAVTHHQPDGNRLVSGQSNLPELISQDIVLAGQPLWLTAVSLEQAVLWVVVLTDGQVQGFLVAETAVSAVQITPNSLPEGMPPLLVVENAQPRIVVPSGDFSPHTHPVLLENGLAYVATNGDLVIEQDEQETRLDVQALPDARLLVDENGRLLFLSHPTTSYGHNVLGDGVEAAAITLVETEPTVRIVQTIPIPSPHVIEGISPIWVDWNGDGSREVIVTRSSDDEGAQIVMYDENGTLIATGPAIGQGFRWRHQLAVAPFGPAGERELVDVRTPHIGGRVEFFQWQGTQLNIVAQTRGYTSHVLGSRNLDLGVAGLFDASGYTTLLLPSQDRTKLAGIQHHGDEAVVAWELPIGGKVVTNLMAVALNNGKTAVGLGRSDNILRIWQP